MTTLTESAPSKPPRRWYRYSLRSLLGAVAVFAVLFGYLGYQQREQVRIVDRIRTVNPELRVVYETPGWLAWTGINNTALDNVIEVHIDPYQGTIDEEVIADLNRLPHLRALTRPNFHDRQISHPLPEYPTPPLTITTGHNYQEFWRLASLKTVDRLASAPALGKQVVERCLRDWEEEIDTLLPRFLPRDDLNHVAREAETGVETGQAGYDILLRKILESDDEALQFQGARLAWRIGSKNNARRVLNLVRSRNPKTDEEQRLWDRVEIDLSVRGMRAGMLTKNFYWFVWLAALSPRPEYGPLIRLVDEWPNRTAEYLYAMGACHDPDAFEYLTEELQHNRGHAAAMGLRELGDPAAEPALIKLLVSEARRNWFDAHRVGAELGACRALEKLGTTAAIPSLQWLAEGQRRHSHPIDVSQAATAAIAAIESRDKSPTLSK